MTDQDLEQRLRDHYRAIDPVHAPRALASRVDEALDQAPRRRVIAFRFGPAATLLAAAAVVTLALVFRAAGIIPPVGASPSPSATALPSVPVTSAPSTSPVPSGSPLPAGSLPPISTSSWLGLDVQALPGGPLGVTSVTTWARGYLALGPSDGTAPLPALASTDGRTWVQLPDVFGPTSSAVAAPCGSGVIVVTTDANGNATTWSSTDGTAWASSPATSLRATDRGDLAGAASGAVGVVTGNPNTLAATADCRTWQAVNLPGAPGASVRAVAAFGGGFVAVGDPVDPAASPVAWISADGRTWTSAAVQSKPGDAFTNVWAGAAGLVARTTQPLFIPGLVSFWTSSDGSRWTPSDADPFGVSQSGEGVGSAGGLFTGDGTRVLAFGSSASAGSGNNPPYEYWTSADGSHWTKVTLSGDTSSVAAGQIMPFLLRDGILWSGDPGAWFGTATP